MLKTACINPGLAGLLAACGHGDKILIADGNYPLESNTGGNTKKVYLGLTHGVPTVTQVLEVIDKTLAIEAAEVMVPGSGEEPEIFGEFRSILTGDVVPGKLDRYEFYEACKQDNVKIAVSTGEKRVFANILITVGVA
ncbi:RbsD/FucU family protein [Ruminiclostridium cellobioparum]|uniref:Fucose dissimilation pathway protein FucU n=1 Tax=Ruminiclostridium cellobioparum subsp. termitidis CT1112 TaxID=1195236 RepID=S0FWM4_RUMCE|nr:RbsD/FucU family protein [Ruminiclostridium cellobioparum]EMS73574.1 Fucose dissimilation pathway protein FucU [Ruminiclostridium cellobioparum subsp. termitidis CT1112]